MRSEPVDRRHGVLAACLVAAGVILATIPRPGVALAQSGTEAAEPESRRPHDFSPIIMPIPISNPALGDGLGIGAGVLYKAGGSDRPWATGVGGLYTDNGSWAAAVFQKAYIGEDRFRILGGGGVGEFNIDFYGVGAAAGDRGFSIPITQKAGFATAQALMRVAPHTYVGLQYRLVDMTTSINFDPPPFPDMDIPPLELNSTVSALGLSAQYDTRDDEFRPGSGLYGTAVWLQADEALGSDHGYGRVEAGLNGYSSPDERTVWAWRASACWAGDGAPFYDICNFGSQADLRGYVQGQYRDHSMFAVQAEYRRSLTDRFGIVVFAGVGAVASEFGEFGSEELLPAGGIGIRYLASREYGLNVGIDYAVGEDSSAVYFRIGEAF